MILHNKPLEELLIFTRYPRAGKVKTRLIEKLGPGEAARIHSLLARQALDTAQQLAGMRPVDLTLWYTGGTVSEMQNWLGNGITLAEQQGKDLGQRMAAAFKASWASGFQSAVLFGSDCPFLDALLLDEAFGRLRNCDLVLGPATDGGYYLIGLHRRVDPHKAALLFEDIDWGSALPFQQTVERAQKAGLSISTLKELHDIDRPEDLVYLRDHSDPQRGVTSRYPA